MSNLELWTRASNYSGTDFSDYYCGLARTRDSDTLTKANFDAVLDALGGETKRNVIVVRASHWGCGWVEQILVHKSAKKKLKILADCLTALADYPVLDDELLSEYEREYIEETFDFYKSDFTGAITTYLGIDADSVNGEDLELCAYGLYQYDCGYCGSEDAYVNEAVIQRYLKTRNYSDYIADTNTVLTLLKTKNTN